MTGVHEHGDRSEGEFVAFFTVKHEEETLQIEKSVVVTSESSATGSAYGRAASAYASIPIRAIEDLTALLKAVHKLHACNRTTAKASALYYLGGYVVKKQTTPRRLEPDATVPPSGDKHRKGVTCGGVSLNRNEEAHLAARGLTDRVPGNASSPGRPEPLCSNNEICKHHYLSRRVLPLPHSSLCRAQAVTLRLLQSSTYPSPAALHRMYPERFPSPDCPLCGGYADFKHVL
ncbi:hypothetical protein HPB52_018808 [Rhipicephalus sanguineus]|uniref:Tick transposon n=1 Tax=Rhipicephalus sanguineus TaxID=34632 RepID=A0A9D4PHC1_RHISA|nr:hypothetical protein HPB52_018808 [Rhipicephalus sanguineus]